MSKVKIDLKVPGRTRITDLLKMGETEQSIQERIDRLKTRHEQLMLDNPDYAALYTSLPDRSDFVTDVPILENAVIPALILYNQMLIYIDDRKRWKRERDTHYKNVVIEGKSKLTRIK